MRFYSEMSRINIWEWISVFLICTAVTTAFAQTNITSLRFPTTCRLTRGGHEYAGRLTTTVGGQTCQRWTSHNPHHNYYVDSVHYPEGSAQYASNYCRNPDAGYFDGLWCYTTNPSLRWRNCDVPMCDCKLTRLGTEYEGVQRRTIGGNLCQNWGSQSPNAHPYQNISQFPDTDFNNLQNYCRNPNGSQPNGPWCYSKTITLRGTWWDYCNVTVCDIPMVSVDEIRPSTTTLSTTPLTTLGSQSLPSKVSTPLFTLPKSPPTSFPKTLSPTSATNTKVAPITGPEIPSSYVLPIAVSIVLIVLIASVLGGILLLVRTGKIRLPKFPPIPKFPGISKAFGKSTTTADLPKIRVEGIENPIYDTPRAVFKREVDTEVQISTDHQPASASCSST